MARNKLSMKHGRPTKRKKRIKRYLVVCNGEVTEKQYFSFLNSFCSDITISIKPKRRDPQSLAIYAREMMEQDLRESSSLQNGGKSDPYEHIFVVTDVDLYTPQQLKEASKICGLKNMSLIISNPCFEIWLIDHCRSCPEVLSLFSDAKKQAESLGLTQGKRSKEIVISKLEGHLHAAIVNANAHMNDANQIIKRQNLNTLDFAPWTDLPKVIQLMGVNHD